MSVQIKLLIGSFISIVCLLIIGGWGIVALEQVADSSTAMVEKGVKPIIQVNKMEHTAGALFLNYLTHVALNDPEEMARTEKEIHALEAQMGQDMKTLTSDAGGQTMPGLLSEWQTFHQANKQGLEQSKSFSKEDAAQTVLGQGRTAYHKLYHSIEQLVTERQTAMNDLQQQVEQTRLTARWGLGVAIVVFGLLLVATSLGVALRVILRPLRVVQASIGEMGEGNLTHRIPLPTHRDEIVAIGEGINHLADSLTRTARTMALQSGTINACMSQLTTLRNNLGQDADKSHDTAKEMVRDNHTLVEEISDIQQAAGEALQSLDGILSSSRELLDNTNTIAAASEEANQNVSTMASAAEEMSANIAEVNQTLSRVNHSVSAVGNSVSRLLDSQEQVRQQCQAANQESAQANQQAREAHTLMDALNDSAQEIGKVVGIIQNIAAQTNMLALNAAIEAAGAGEAGKGFAVVANEVKELARQTGEAIGMISQQIHAIQSKTTAAGEAVEKITSRIEVIDNANSHITQSVADQTRTVNEIGQAIQGVTTAAASVLHNAEELERAAQEVARAALEASAGTGEIARSTSGLATAADRVTSQTQDAQSFAKAMLESSQKTKEASSAFQGKIKENFLLSAFLSSSARQFAILSNIVEASVVALHRTQASFALTPPPFDIETVKQSHLVWLNQFEQAICGRLVLQQENFPEAQFCPIGQWAEQEQKSGAVSPVGELQSSHQTLHQLARQLVQNIKTMDRTSECADQAKSLLHQFETERKRFFDYLDDVYRQT